MTERKRDKPARPRAKAAKPAAREARLVPKDRDAALPAGGPQTLRHLYDRWLAERLGRAAWLAEHRRRSEALSSRAAYMLGSMRAAKRFVGKGKDKDLRTMTREMASAGAEARSALAKEHRARLAAFRREEEAILGGLEEMAERYLRHHRPELVFRVHPAAGGKFAIVQTGPVSRDDAVLLVYLFTGKFPTRHDFFEDEAVFDANEGLARWYPEPDAPGVFGDPERAEREILAKGRRALPLRTFIPIPVPGAGTRRFRVVCQGAVGELESRGARSEFANRVPAKALELLSGYLIGLHVAGRISFRVDWPERGANP